MRDHGIARQTVSDIKKRKDEYIKYSLTANIGPKLAVKRMRKPDLPELDAAVY